LLSRILAASTTFRMHKKLDDPEGDVPLYSRGNREACIVDEDDEKSVEIETTYARRKSEMDRREGDAREG
jgi:hypothetical protein